MLEAAKKENESSSDLKFHQKWDGVMTPWKRQKLLLLPPRTFNLRAEDPIKISAQDSSKWALRATFCLTPQHPGGVADTGDSS